MAFDPSERAGAVVFLVLAQPRAAQGRIGPVAGDRLKVAVAAAPTDGTANRALAELLARALGVPKSAVEIVHGASSRRKTVRVAGATRAQVLALASQGEP
ncbi:MAG TPA: DUF167 domain-containing protein [Polyangia bacterium]|nr:DUF167 domain-containing protein [Polyangia bacterium]